VLWARGSSPKTYALLGTGFCGGFTTFSAFSLEVVRMWDAGQRTTTAVYILSSVVLSVFAAWLGFVLARKT
jgi:CrcB protein